MRLLKQLQQVNAPSKEAYAIEYNHIADSLQQVQPKVHEAITRELAQAQAKEEAEMKMKENYKTVLLGVGGIVCFIGVNYIMYRRKKRSTEGTAKKKAELETHVQ